MSTTGNYLIGSIATGRTSLLQAQPIVSFTEKTGRRGKEQRRQLSRLIRTPVPYPSDPEERRFGLIAIVDASYIPLSLRRMLHARA